MAKLKALSLAAAIAIAPAAGAFADEIKPVETNAPVVSTQLGNDASIAIAAGLALVLALVINDSSSGT